MQVSINLGWSPFEGDDGGRGIGGTAKLTGPMLCKKTQCNFLISYGDLGVMPVTVRVRLPHIPKDFVTGRRLSSKTVPARYPQGSHLSNSRLVLLLGRLALIHAPQDLCSKKS